MMSDRPDKEGLRTMESEAVLHEDEMETESETEQGGQERRTSDAGDRVDVSTSILDDNMSEEDNTPPIAPNVSTEDSNVSSHLRSHLLRGKSKDCQRDRDYSAPAASNRAALVAGTSSDQHTQAQKEIRHGDKVYLARLKDTVKKTEESKGLAKEIGESEQKMSETYKAICRFRVEQARAPNLDGGGAEQRNKHVLLLQQVGQQDRQCKGDRKFWEKNSH